MTDQKLISTREAAARRGVTVKTINLWAQKHGLPVADTEKVSGARLFDPTVIDEFTPSSPSVASSAAADGALPNSP